MDISRFKDGYPGSLVPIANRDHAFIPADLPAGWKFDGKLWPLLAEAKQRVGLLEGLGRTLPNPGLLLRPLEDREALKSSRLEGTFATPRELLLFEMEPHTPKPGEDKANDWLEVYNYKRALQLGMQTDLPLSLRLICDLHRLLLSGVRGRDKTPGEFRKIQVAIGSDRRFIPVPQTDLLPCLDAFEKYMHAETAFDPLVHGFLCHYQFETIHPFVDGNGRVGRLLLAMMLQRHCGLTKPWLYMSDYFERYRDDYCQRLFNVSAKGAWTEWIEFCLQATIDHADATVNRCGQLVKIREQFMELLKSGKGAVRLNRIVDDLFVSPYVRIADLPKRLNVSYPTARTDVQRLTDAGILEELPNASQKTYYAPRVYEVIYEDIEQ